MTNRFALFTLVTCGVFVIVGCDAADTQKARAEAERIAAVARQEAEHARMKAAEALEAAKIEAERQAAAASKLAQEKLKIDAVRDRAEEIAKIAQDAQRKFEERFSTYDNELQEIKDQLASLKSQLEKAVAEKAASNDEQP